MKNKITSFKNESEILPDKGHPNLMSRGSDFGLKTQFSFKSEMRELNLSMGKLNVETNLEMSCYLKEKCNVLEKENILLKNEIAMKMNEKDKFEYFLRLRKELLEEVQSLKNELSIKEITAKIEIDKLEEQVERLKEREVEMKVKEKELQDKLAKGGHESKKTKAYGSLHSSPRSSPKVAPKKDPKLKSRKDSNPQSREKTPNKLVELEDHPKLVEHKDQMDIGKEEHEIQADIIPEGEEKKNESLNFDDKININTNEENELAESDFIDTGSRHVSEPENPYTSLIAELKNQIKFLEATAQEKEDMINALKEEYDNYQEDANQQIEELNQSVGHWKDEYNKQLWSNKTVFDKYVEMADLREKHVKEQHVSLAFDLEKKILHLEKVNNTLSSEMEKINEMNAAFTRENENRIIRLNEQNSKLLFKYEELWKTYEEDLNSLTDLINKIKQKYIDREIEVLDLKIYYNNAVNEYAKPITELKNNKFNKIEDTYVKQIKEVEELKENVHTFVNENAKLQVDLLEARPKFRQKITETTIKFEKALVEITGKHSNIDSRLTILHDFMDHFKEKFTFFQSLIDDKKNLEEKCHALEIKTNQAQNVYNDKEVIDLREKLIRTESE